MSLPLEIVLPAYPLVDMYNMQHGGWRRLSRQRNIYSLWRHRRSCAVAQETHSHIETTICNVPAMAPMAVTDSDICAPLSPYHIPTCKKNQLTIMACRGLVLSISKKRMYFSTSLFCSLISYVCVSVQKNMA